MPNCVNFPSHAGKAEAEKPDGNRGNHDRRMGHPRVVGGRLPSSFTEQSRGSHVDPRRVWPVTLCLWERRLEGERLPVWLQRADFPPDRQGSSKNARRSTTTEQRPLGMRGFLSVRHGGRSRTLSGVFRQRRGLRSVVYAPGVPRRHFRQNFHNGHQMPCFLPHP